MKNNAFMLSVIIPAHNEEQYLVSTLTSLKQQTYPDFEVIVVCDGCTDKTPELANKYAEKVLVLQERKGPAAARNAGAKLARGEKLVFLDADTQPSSMVFEQIMKQDADTIGTCRLEPSPATFKHRLAMHFKKNFLSPFGVTNGLIFVSKQYFQAVQGFGDFQKGEDGDFVRRLKRAGKQFVVLREPVLTSMRRMDRKGYLGVWWYWLKHPFTQGKKPYEVIR
ncbi:glycosyltransferase [Candidatus Woesearchaeota archaeon]|nr:glycosyltransferase [Candidatus Woesearchaeota archaeon]